jgi:hypothetical protein
MKRMRLGWLLLAGSLISVILGGCKSKPEPVLPLSYPVPLVPFTQKIIIRVQDNGQDIKVFQYYISAAIILEKESRNEKLEISDTGEGLLTKYIIREQIEIFPGTRGILINYTDTNPDALVIEVCFDEKDTTKTLKFIKKASEDRYYLDYNQEMHNIEFGGEIYSLHMFENTSSPHLLIRYDDPTARSADVQQAEGQMKSK